MQATLSQLPERLRREAQQRLIQGESRESVMQWLIKLGHAVPDYIANPQPLIPEADWVARSQSRRGY